jgi:hypothetical protein
MDFDEATKKQLLTIALHEDCPLDTSMKQQGNSSLKPGVPSSYKN